LTIAFVSTPVSAQILMHAATVDLKAGHFM